MQLEDVQKDAVNVRGDGGRGAVGTEVDLLNDCLVWLILRNDVVGFVRDSLQTSSGGMVWRCFETPGRDVKIGQRGIEHTVADVERYAKRVRKGNKSGFVQDAIEAYIAAIDHVQANQSSVLRTAYSKTVKEHLIDKQSDDG